MKLPRRTFLRAAGVSLARHDKKAADPKAISHECHRRQLADFVEAIELKRAPAVDGREGRKAVALINAMYESNATGRTVELRG